MNVAVLGASGRMGAETCRAVENASDLRLVARLGRGGSVGSAVDHGASVVVDFTQPDVVMDNIDAALRLGLHVVVGTSGFDEERLQRVESMVHNAPDRGVIIAPNFALGAVLMMRFAREAAPYFSAAEIVETHHARKLDAPSGTALHTAREMGQARLDSGTELSADATSSSLPGARGAEVDGVRIHSLRLPGAVAHQDVQLSNAGEILSIRHDSLDRAAFMPGVLLAIREVSKRPGLTLGLEPLLDFG